MRAEVFIEQFALTECDVMVDKWLPVLSSGESATFVDRTLLCSVAGVYWYCEVSMQ